MLEKNLTERVLLKASESGADFAEIFAEKLRYSSLTDHLRTIGLVEAAYEFAKEVLADDGIFIAKVFQGGAEGSLLADAKKNFKKVGHCKPDASRQGSPETYLVCQGFRGSLREEA